MTAPPSPFALIPPRVLPFGIFVWPLPLNFVLLSALLRPFVTCVSVLVFERFFYVIRDGVGFFRHDLGGFGVSLVP